MNEQHHPQDHPNEAAAAATAESGVLADLEAPQAEQITGGHKVGAGHLILPSANTFYSSGVYKSQDDGK